MFREQQTSKSEETPKVGGLRGLLKNVEEVISGMAAHDMSRYASRTRASMEHLLILIAMGDLPGIPILPATLFVSSSVLC